MPIFEYRCDRCQGRFEQIVWRTEEKAECPRCGALEVSRLVSTFAVAAEGARSVSQETGPCPCGAPRRGMCGD